MEIREYRPTDFEQLYEIDHAAFTGDIAYSRLELQFYLRSRKCRTLVAQDSNEIVGFVGSNMDDPTDLGAEIDFVVDGKKMSRSAGNAVTLRDVVSLGYTARDVRYLFLSTHYRQPLSYSEEKLKAAKVELILIPSESTAPAAVRQALGSVFQNIYAEGYRMTTPAR